MAHIVLLQQILNASNVNTLCITRKRLHRLPVNESSLTGKCKLNSKSFLSVVHLMT